MIKADVMKRSLAKAQEILNCSPNLQAVEAEVDYLKRDQFFQDLLGEEGYVSFHPTVTQDIVDPFRAMLRKGLKELSDKYYNMPYGEQSDVARFHWYLADSITYNITVDNMLKNTVPGLAVEYIESHAKDPHIREEVQKEANKFRSPKLSKVLVKLFGEQHEIVSWYTCKCPKSLPVGELKEWAVNISILPHHIAGMSYYAPLNHGGARWKEGYEGTSCMDTLRNGMGNTIFQLMSSMKDETMAIAYLTKTSDNDIWKPVYEARCLLRVVHYEGKPFVIACRSYFTSNETKHILYDGLKNQYGIHTVSDMIDHMRNSVSTIDIERPYSEDITFEVPDREVKCRHCDGDGYTGHDDWGDRITCEHCDGDGSWEVSGGDYLPYIDDTDFMQVRGDKIFFYLPVEYLKSVGLCVEPQETQEEAVVASSVSEAQDTINVDFEAVERHIAEFLNENVDEGELARVIGAEPMQFLRNPLFVHGGGYVRYEPVFHLQPRDGVVADGN